MDVVYIPQTSKLLSLFCTIVPDSKVSEGHPHSIVLARSMRSHNSFSGPINISLPCSHDFVLVFLGRKFYCFFINTFFKGDLWEIHLNYCLDRRVFYLFQNSQIYSLTIPTQKYPCQCQH